MGTEFSTRLKTYTPFPITCRSAFKITNPGITASPAQMVARLIRPSVGRSSETLLVKLPTRLQQPETVSRSQLKTGDSTSRAPIPWRWSAVWAVQAAWNAPHVLRVLRSGDFQHVGILVDIGNGFPVHFRSSVSHA